MWRRWSIKVSADMNAFSLLKNTLCWGVEDGHLSTAASLLALKIGEFPAKFFVIIVLEPELNVEERVEFAVTPKLFGKWSYEGIQCSEASLTAYLQVKSTKSQVYVPYTAGRY